MASVPVIVIYTTATINFQVITVEILQIREIKTLVYQNVLIKCSTPVYEDCSTNSVVPF